MKFLSLGDICAEPYDQFRPTTVLDAIGVGAALATAGSFGSMRREVRIRGETINLGQLLKLEGLIGSGAEVKHFLSTAPVWVNGERETRRGRKLHLDDVVRVGELELRLTAADLDM